MSVNSSRFATSCFDFNNVFFSEIIKTIAYVLLLKHYDFN